MNSQLTPLSVIILPTYNERENIISVIEAIRSLNSVKVDIVVVDDNSPDGTADLVRASYNSSEVRVIQRVNKKKGLVPSMNDAINQTDHAFIFWLDADMQMSPGYLDRMIKELESNKIDAVIGSRFIAGGADLRNQNKDEIIFVVHKYLSRLLSILVRATLKIESTDVTSGLIGIKRDVLNECSPFTGVHGEYFICLLHDLKRKNYNVLEIPYVLMPRVKGVSKTTEGQWLTMFNMGGHYLKAVLKCYFDRRSF